jgi:excisionase family DNA binding protein
MTVVEQMGAPELLTTAQAAALLGVSRQHVVNLCERGALPYCRVGAHRRLRRTDLETLLTPPLTRDQERSLWLHHLVAARLIAQPAHTLDTAHRNLDKLRLTHPSGMAARWLAHWQLILDQGLDRVLQTLVSRSAESIELRQNSPFAGVLPTDERMAALAEFRRHWQREHAA